MRRYLLWSVVLGLLLGFGCLSADVRAADSSGKAEYASGTKLLAEGEFDAAMRAFGNAARAEQRNQQYVQQYLLLRQIVQIRKLIDTETDPARWEYYARALHTFYAQNRLYDALLAIDLRLHEKLGTSVTATLLAETQLACHKPTDAAETLSQISEEDSSSSTKSLLGIALATDDKLPEAKRLADTIELESDAGPGAKYRLARLHAMVGNEPEAIAQLRECFETIPPSVLDSFKLHAKSSKEFEAMAGSEQFTAVLKTESKIAESSCSGGSSCAGCPSRGSCESSQ